MVDCGNTDHEVGTSGITFSRATLQRGERLQIPSMQTFVTSQCQSPLPLPVISKRVSQSVPQSAVALQLPCAVRQAVRPASSKRTWSAHLGE